MKNSDYNHIKELLNESGLLGPNELLRNFSSNYDFSNETILITGAAGSIGSEIVRQLLGSSFKNLILVDNAESALYHLVKEFEFDENPNIEFVLVDIRDEDAVKWLYETFKTNNGFSYSCL